MAIRAEIRCFQREAVELPVSIIDDAGAAVDITGYSFAFVVKERFGAIVLFEIGGADIAIVNPASAGLVTVTITAETLDVPPDVYEWELRRTDSANDAVLAYGSFYVRRSLTAEVGS